MKLKKENAEMSLNPSGYLVNYNGSISDMWEKINC